MKKLIELEVSNGAITDEGVKSLRGLTSLKRLWLFNTEVTDGSVEILLGLRQLTELHIANTNLTGEGLGRLSGLPNLTGLWAGGVPISRNELRALSKMKQLKKLLICGDMLTDDDVQWLERELPDCDISAPKDLSRPLRKPKNPPRD